MFYIHSRTRRVRWPDARLLSPHLRRDIGLPEIDRADRLNDRMVFEIRGLL